jgi:hypothetical protein
MLRDCSILPSLHLKPAETLFGFQDIPKNSKLDDQVETAIGVFSLRDHVEGAVREMAGAGVAGMSILANLGDKLLCGAVA